MLAFQLANPSSSLRPAGGSRCRAGCYLTSDSLCDSHPWQLPLLHTDTSTSSCVVNCNMRSKMKYVQSVQSAPPDDVVVAARRPVDWTSCLAAALQPRCLSGALLPSSHTQTNTHTRARARTHTVSETVCESSLWCLGGITHRLSVVFQTTTSCIFYIRVLLQGLGYHK